MATLPFKDTSNHISQWNFSPAAPDFTLVPTFLYSRVHQNLKDMDSFSAYISNLDKSYENACPKNSKSSKQLILKKKKKAVPVSETWIHPMKFLTTIS